MTVRTGEQACDDLLGPVRADADLMARIWADAESRVDDEPGKVWCIATVRQDGRRIAAAWAAAIEIEHEGRTWLRCCDNYERPGWRGRGLYAAAYARRHAEIVVHSPLPAITWIFDQPRALHELDGWQVTGTGISREPAIAAHRWFEMRRPRAQSEDWTRGRRS